MSGAIPTQDAPVAAALQREVAYAVLDTAQAANAVALFVSSSIAIGRTEITPELRVRVEDWRAAMQRELQARERLQAALPDKED